MFVYIPAGQPISIKDECSRLLKNTLGAFHRSIHSLGTSIPIFKHRSEIWATNACFRNRAAMDAALAGGTPLNLTLKEKYRIKAPEQIIGHAKKVWINAHFSDLFSKGITVCVLILAKQGLSYLFKTNVNNTVAVLPAWQRYHIIDLAPLIFKVFNIAVDAASRKLPQLTSVSDFIQRWNDRLEAIWWLRTAATPYSYSNEVPGGLPVALSLIAASFVSLCAGVCFSRVAPSATPVQIQGLYDQIKALDIKAFQKADNLNTLLQGIQTQFRNGMITFADREELLRELANTAFLQFNTRFPEALKGKAANAAGLISNFDAEFWAENSSFRNLFFNTNKAQYDNLSFQLAVYKKLVKLNDASDLNDDRLSYSIIFPYEADEQLVERSFFTYQRYLVEAFPHFAQFASEQRKNGMNEEQICTQFLLQPTIGGSHATPYGPMLAFMKALDPDKSQPTKPVGNRQPPKKRSMTIHDLDEKPLGSIDIDFFGLGKALKKLTGAGRLYAILARLEKKLLGVCGPLKDADQAKFNTLSRFYKKYEDFRKS